MYKYLLACLLSVSALFLPSTAQAAECTEIGAVAANITNPGSYCLSANLTASTTSSAFITISANDVVLDCRGYTLRNNSVATNGNAYGIYLSGKSNVHVRNCRIAGGFLAGIYAHQYNSNANANRTLSFSGNTITGALWVGIIAYGTDITIRDNRIHDIGGRNSFSMGIRVGASTLASETRSFLVAGNYITGVTSAVNNAYGIYANNALASTFDDNIITGVAAFTSPNYYAYGVYIGAGELNRARGNRIVFPGTRENEVGVGAPSALDNDCWDNHVRGATTAIASCDATHGNF